MAIPADGTPLKHPEHVFVSLIKDQSLSTDSTTPRMTVDHQLQVVHFFTLIR